VGRGEGAGGDFNDRLKPLLQRVLVAFGGGDVLLEEDFEEEEG